MSKAKAKQRQLASPTVRAVKLPRRQETGYRQFQQRLSVIDGLKSGIIRPLWEGTKLPGEFALLVRVELAEVYMSARESEPALPVRNDSVLLLVRIQILQPRERCYQ